MASAFLTLFAAALVLLIFYLINKYTHWKRHGIPTPKGIIPFFGHILPALTARISFSEFHRKIYDEFKDYSMAGYYKLTSPVLIIRDPKLVKTVLQSKFSNFHENGLKIQPEVDPLLAKNPFFTYGEVWATGRKRLTYAFSNVRLKTLFMAVSGVNKKFEDFLNRRLKSNGKYEVELKKLFSKYTGEVVANAGLGIEGLCFEDEPNPAAFDSFSEILFNQGLLRALELVFLFMPQLNKFFKFSFVPKKLDRLFRKIVAENLENRRKETTPRNDFLQLMIDLEKTGNETIDEESIVAHAFSFYGDGYETSSITLSFIGYQLATHPDVQEKLREEILSTIERHGGELTFEGLKEMTYMDQVINESQRLYPSAGHMSKYCTEEIELEGSDGLRYRVKPGTEVIISIHGLHLDPRYWPNPEVYEPERFNEENKQSIDKMVFLPFGEGPRMCVGMRMALLQIKACLATLLRNYKLELSPKTQLPLKISPLYFLTLAVGGLWVHITKL